MAVMICLEMHIQCLTPWKDAASQMRWSIASAQDRAAVCVICSASQHRIVSSTLFLCTKKSISGEYTAMNGNCNQRCV